MSLFDLRFLEQHVLAHDGIKFLQLKLFSLGARVLFGDIVVARIRAANHFNKNRAWFRHGRNPRKFDVIPSRANYRAGGSSQVYSIMVSRLFVKCVKRGTARSGDAAGCSRQ